MATPDSRAPDKDDLLPPASASRRIGVTPRTLSRYADAGLIPHVLLPSGVRRYRVGDVDAFRRGPAAEDVTDASTADDSAA